MSAVDRVKQFLRLMEARDLDKAESLMALSAKIIFPNGTQFDSQYDMVKVASGRYQWVKKTFDTIDHFVREDGCDVVYVIGTLYGVNIHGIEFSGIRYIDRFVLHDGKIIEQHVWNDLAESGVLHQTESAST